MLQIELSPAAVQKLSDIKAYIDTELRSPIAAENTIRQILDALERLARFPESCPKLSVFYNKAPENFQETRLLVCGNYIAIYDCDETHVRVLQIYHGSENYIRHLLKG